MKQRKTPKTVTDLGTLLRAGSAPARPRLEPAPGRGKGLPPLALGLPQLRGKEGSTCLWGVHHGDKDRGLMGPHSTKSRSLHPPSPQEVVWGDVLETQCSPCVLVL